MLKTFITNVGTPTTKNSYNLINSISLQSVRWHRKPRWVPVAKTKMFKVPERKPEDPAERAELARLHKNYKTQMRSIRSFLKIEVDKQKITSSADHLIISPEEELADWHKSIQINDEWNLKIASERNVRLEKRLAERKEYILTRLEAKEERDREEFEKAEELIRKEKELSKTYILKHNLDEAIEFALANPIDYNFAIDLQGNMYSGRSGGVNTKTDEVNEKNGKVISAVSGGS